MVCTEYEPWSQPGGPPGSTPADRTDPSLTASHGQDGTVQTHAAVTLSDLATLASPSHFGMMLNACERDYVSQNFTDALERLIWLKAVIAAILKLPATQVPPEAALERYRAYIQKINALIVQLK